MLKVILPQNGRRETGETGAAMKTSGQWAESWVWGARPGFGSQLSLICWVTLGNSYCLCFLVS